MDEFIFAIWLSAILELVLLICFFVLCSNVSKIKKAVSSSGEPPTSYTKFAMFLAAGDKEKAKLELMNMIMSEYLLQANINRNPEILKTVLAKYDKAMKEVDLKIDPQTVYETKNLFR